MSVIRERTWSLIRSEPCDTCGAPAGQDCTVGQYQSPSPHMSIRKATVPHSRRGRRLLEAYHMGYWDGARSGGAA